MEKVDLSKVKDIKSKISDEPIKVDLSKPAVKDDIKTNASDDAKVDVKVDVKSDPKVDVKADPKIDTKAGDGDVKADPILKEIKKDGEVDIKKDDVDGEVKIDDKKVQPDDKKVELDKKKGEPDEKKGKKLPEAVEKLLSFIEDTNGTIEDFVRLNQDFSKSDDKIKLKEYYKRTKPNLSLEDIDFLIEDKFTFDPDEDDEREIKKKKIAFKEEISKADSYLTGLKDKYYDEVKLGSRLSPEQKEAIEFYNKFKEDNEVTKTVTSKQVEVFKQKTNEVFNDKFEGFKFDVGEKTFQYSVKDPSKVKDYQSDIFNFIGEFLDEDKTLKDAEGYHKALFAAKNADAIAKHFYEQGAADAIKNNIKESKNIDMGGRTEHGKFIESDGVKVRVVSGEDSSQFKIKLKKQ